jgi:hypothetical protein
VVFGVPILRQPDMGKAGGETVDERNDRIALRHAKRAVGTEVVLDIDDEKDVLISRGGEIGVPRQGFLSPLLRVSRRDLRISVRPSSL